MITRFMLLPLMAILSATVLTGTAFAGTPQQNYQTGFGDGQTDCQSGTYDAINSHSNSGHHSASYMQGYHQAMDACVQVQHVSDNGAATGVGQNGYNQNSNNREQPMGESNNQHQFCVTVFGNCGVTNGQSQGLQN